MQGEDNMSASRLASVVEDNGPYTGSCGYCGGEDSNVSHGMWGHRLSVEDYNDLLDRGWRRSGCWLYQPDLQKTCCRQYTIRLDVRRFQPNKKQAKARPAASPLRVLDENLVLPFMFYLSSSMESFELSTSFLSSKENASPQPDKPTLSQTTG